MSGRESTGAEGCGKVVSPHASVIAEVPDSNGSDN